jgi:hypothetical protein
MIDALIKRVSVTYKCYEMYAYRGLYQKVRTSSYLDFGLTHRSIKSRIPLMVMSNDIRSAMSGRIVTVKYMAITLYFWVV